MLSLQWLTNNHDRLISRRGIYLARQEQLIAQYCLLGC
nr:MAG TPA: Protein of unknown function (DUF2859) [Caudoviricetes sp.]